ncbi:hypothetical protein TBR22_A21650 [Luteitalea sp. TBR-22]|uniref:IPT/TIG domain-containing protein n=1 Tax=Luteitalea sp. TBR-22 TaxID=2802971 RepID=UPI001AF10339|nr:IPT/TIG domain-containing protein [Luteitalea sp. TBR-22]BCS32941.1 hypothetical protein TBR22_A21650 [Luteitalea sp. TBR-22]
MTRLVFPAMVLASAIALSVPAPLVAAPPSLTTWLFAEGSTNGAFGFEEEILIGNPNAVPVVVTFELFTQDGQALAPITRTVPARARFTESVRQLAGDRAGIALKLTSALPIVAERTMYWGGGLFRPEVKGYRGRVSDMRGGHSEHGTDEGARTWYFAEGEGKFFNTFISVANPGDTPANVVVSYRDDTGTEVKQAEVVPPHARRTFWPTAVLSRRLQSGRAGFATIVTSDVDVVAERQMYWGDGAPSGIRGGHAAMGVSTPALTWLFAEGIQGSLTPGGDPSFDTFVLLFNPSTGPIDVTVEFFGQAGVKLAQVVRTVEAGARGGVWAKELPALANQAFSIRATATVPFVAERAVYWRGLSEGTATAGATEPSRQWGFAEGLQGGFLRYQDDDDDDKRRFNTFFPIYNPGTTAATVTVHFYTEHGDTGVSKTITVPGQSRETIWTLLYDELANRRFATFISSTEPIVVERVVYWGKGNKAGHASLGIPLPDSLTLTAATKLPPAPQVTVREVEPSKGATTGGTEVEIEGTGLGNTELGTQVLFGGVPALRLEVEHDRELKAIAPPHALGRVDITLITRGTTVVLPGAFTYVAPGASGDDDDDEEAGSPAAGTKVEIEPRWGPAAGGTIVNVEVENVLGTVIEPGSQVFFGTAAARVVKVERNEIRVVAPAGAAGKVEVTVVTRGQVVARGVFEYF